MPFPNISGTIQTGNLLRAITVTDGRGALAVTVKTAKLIGKVHTVYGLQDAEAKGFTEIAEPFAYKHINEFYTELGGAVSLVIFGYPETMTMTELLTSTNTEGLTQLLNQRDVNIVGIARAPEASYTPGTGFLDTDVSGAALVSRALAEKYQKKNKPVRFLIEGRLADEDADNDFEAKEVDNNFAGIVLGDTVPGNGAAVGLVLGRAVKHPAHVKLGAGTNGALTALSIYVGQKLINERLDIEDLHDTGLITFYRPPGQAGFYIGVDQMCSQDDLHLLARGRVIDKAQRVIAATMIPFLETYIRVEPDGSLNPADAKHIEQTLESQLDSQMSGQISGRQVVIPLQQDIINNSTLQLNVSLQPLGYMTYIKFTLGFTNILIES